MARIQVLAIVLLSLLTLNEASNILVMFPMCAKSHNILGVGVVRNLLEAGHTVTYITCFPEKNPAVNLTQVDVSIERDRLQKEQGDNATEEFFKLKNLVGQKNFADTPFFLYFSHTITKQILTSDAVVDLLSDTEQQFDAVIVEWFFSELMAGIASIFQTPLIWVGTTEAHWQVLRVMDEIPSPAYNLDLFSTRSLPLGFLDRALELWSLLKKAAMVNCFIVPLEMYFYSHYYQSIAEKRGISMPSYSESVYNGSLLFLNSHPSLGTPFKLPQSAKYVGGYHINPVLTPLARELREVMDTSKHGVIYFSMGSNLKSADMTDHMKRSLIEIFSQLKQTVLWKFEDDIGNLPANIHLLKWAPQQSILAHPNLKLFITHGGQLSTTEAIHYGVPLVGIPVFGDQNVNMQTASEKGFGITVKLDENMAPELLDAVEEMLSNPKYTLKAKELSAIYHDRPVAPGKELVHWVEHVISTRGALHLRSPALNVPFYQKAYLDLFALISLTFYLLHKVVSTLARWKTVVKKSAVKTKTS